MARRARRRWSGRQEEEKEEGRAEHAARRRRPGGCRGDCYSSSFAVAQPLEETGNPNSPKPKFQGSAPGTPPVPGTTPPANARTSQRPDGSAPRNCRCSTGIPRSISTPVEATNTRLGLPTDLPRPEVSPINPSTCGSCAKSERLATARRVDHETRRVQQELASAGLRLFPCSSETMNWVWSRSLPRRHALRPAGRSASCARCTTSMRML